MPDRAAVLNPDGTIARRFADLDAGARRFALHLGRIGLPAGRVVSIHAPNSAAWIEALLGIWMADGIPLLSDSFMNAGALAAAESNCGVWGRAVIGPDGLDVLAVEAEPVPFSTVRPDLIKLTSGTTSTPRAVLFSAEQILADCDAICPGMGIGPSDINYGVIAFSHSYGFSNLVTPLLCRGVPLVTASDALPHAILHGIRATNATVLPAVPAIFQALAGIPASIPSLRLCISAGAPLRSSVADTFHRQFGLKLHSFYGASECGGICFDASPDRIAHDNWVGTPLPGVSVRQRACDGDRTLVDVISPAAGLGYFPESDAALPGQSIFRSGDWLIGSVSDGFRIVDRESDWINVAGRKLAPSAIESVLRDFPGVIDAVVLGLDDLRRGQRIAALVAAEDGITEVALAAHCRSRLAQWQIPRDWLLVDRLPFNARGKINRRELADSWPGHSP